MRKKMAPNTSDHIPDYGLVDRVILVTGGTSGIGYAVADLALRQGARVAIAGSDADRTRRAVDALPGVRGYPLDVRDPVAVEAVVHDVEDSIGPLDAVVASAGISKPAPSESMSTSQWNDVLDVNLTGTFHTLRSAGRRMRRRGRGSLVAVGSVNTFGGHVDRANYAASKSGLTGLVKSLSIEWGLDGVRVNAVAPGPVDTPMMWRVLSQTDIDRTLVSRVPLGRLSTPYEQAAPILFLISDAASFITGAVLPVDGGVTAGFFTDSGAGRAADNKEGTA